MNITIKPKAEYNPKTELGKKFQELLKETQALHADNPLTEEEIAAEIDAYRRGERTKVIVDTN